LAVFFREKSGIEKRKNKLPEEKTLFLTLYFLLLILLITFYVTGIVYLRKGLQNTGCRQNAPLPSVSIIVCMHNEAPNAAACLEKLVTQNYSGSNIEIIAVNDRSSDQTDKIIKEFSAKYSSVRLISINDLHRDFAPKKFAIDCAVRSAKGEIILLTDADGRPAPDWTEKMISCFTSRVGMVIGYAPYLTSPPFDNIVYRFLALEYLSHAAVAAASAGSGYPLTCVGTNMAYRKEVYLELDGFGIYKNLHTGDDDLFLQRVREETDWIIKYNNSKDSHVFNAPPSNWKKFFHQRLRYASKGLLYSSKVSMILILFFVFNLLLLISPMLLLGHLKYFIGILIILFIKAFTEYAFLNKATSVLEDRRHLSLFPIVFLLHIPYVFLFGLLSQIKSFEWGDRLS
jgi:cellulose synthase/poly-beta-1,6-N-acetylglucosamine synthase-like glycosyltransferase